MPWNLSAERQEQFLTVSYSFGRSDCLQVVIARLLTWSFLIGRQAPVTSGGAGAVARIALALTASCGAVGPHCHRVLREMTLCELRLWQPNHKAHYFSAGSASVHRQMCALRNTRRRVYLTTADLLSATLYCFKVPEPIKIKVFLYVFTPKMMRGTMTLGYTPHPYLYDETHVGPPSVRGWNVCHRLIESCFLIKPFLI